MENILELQQVSKTYPKSDFVLDNVTFSLCEIFSLKNDLLSLYSYVKRAKQGCAGRCVSLI